MTHQPYESWLLQEEPLALMERQALEEHIGSCPACGRLAEALQAVRFEFASAEMIGPAPGFVHRWQARLEDQRSVARERRSWIALAASLGMTAVLAILMALQWIGAIEKPTQFITEPVYGVVAVLSILDEFRQMLLVVLKVMPVTWWASLAGLLSILILVWAFTVSRTGGFSQKQVPVIR